MLIFPRFLLSCMSCFCLQFAYYNFSIKVPISHLISMSNSYRKSAECNQIKTAFMFGKMTFFFINCFTPNNILLVPLSTVQMSTKHAEKYKQVVKKSLRELETNSFYSVHNESHAWAIKSNYKVWIIASFILSHF